jgi:hypothetical protein
MGDGNERLHFVPLKDMVKLYDRVEDLLGENNAKTGVFPSTHGHGYKVYHDSEILSQVKWWLFGFLSSTQRFTPRRYHTPLSIIVL